MTRTPSEDSPTDGYKRAAAQAAAAMVEDGMRVGLGTGSTVAFLLPALADRGLRGLRCVATSPATERMARTLGLNVEDLDAVGELDIAIDGADQVDPAGWLVKGGGAALTREKIVAAAARRFVVIVSAEKIVRGAAPAGAAGAAALRRGALYAGRAGPRRRLSRERWRARTAT